MSTKTLISTTVAAAVSALAIIAASPALAASPMGDADPGYPGLNARLNGPTMAKHSNKTMTRQEVRADAVAAAPTHNGEAFYFPEPVGEGKTRAQVKAETLEAIRVGAISNGERYEFPTQQQLESIRMAGARALDPTVAATGNGPVGN